MTMFLKSNLSKHYKKCHEPNIHCINNMCTEFLIQINEYCSLLKW